MLSFKNITLKVYSISGNRFHEKMEFTLELNVHSNYVDIFELLDKKIKRNGFKYAVYMEIDGYFSKVDSNRMFSEDYVIVMNSNPPKDFNVVECQFDIYALGVVRSKEPVVIIKEMMLVGYDCSDVLKLCDKKITERCKIYLRCIENHEMEVATPSTIFLPNLHKIYALI